MNTLDHIRSLDRAIQIPVNGPFADMMWSDPSDEVETWAISDRGAGWLYGSQVVKNFLRKN